MGPSLVTLDPAFASLPVFKGCLLCKVSNLSRKGPRGRGLPLGARCIESALTPSGFLTLGPSWGLAWIIIRRAPLPSLAGGAGGRRQSVLARRSHTCRVTTRDFRFKAGGERREHRSPSLRAAERWWGGPARHWLDPLQTDKEKDGKTRSASKCGSPPAPSSKRVTPSAPGDGRGDKDHSGRRARYAPPSVQASPMADGGDGASSSFWMAFRHRRGSRPSWGWDNQSASQARASKFSQQKRGLTSLLSAPRSTVEASGSHELWDWPGDKANFGGGGR